MSVSSSIGSNIFDICIGLGIPWLSFALASNDPISVKTNQLVPLVLCLVGVVAFLFIMLYLNNWLLTPNRGIALIVVYFIYMIIQLSITDYGEC